MKKSLKCVLIFALTICMLSISPVNYYIEAESIPPKKYPVFKTYEEMMLCYNDNSQLKNMGADEKKVSYWEYYRSISFEEYCEIFNTVIESEMFIYFTDNPEKKPDYINVKMYTDDNWEIIYRLKYEYDDMHIDIYYPTDIDEIKALEEGGLTEYLKLRYPEEEEKGCGSSKQYEKYEATEIITAKDGTKYEFLMVNSAAYVRYKNTPICLLRYRSLPVSEGETQKEANRKFFVELIKDMSISAYIPPEEDTEQETEQGNEVESEADTENTTDNG